MSQPSISHVTATGAAAAAVTATLPLVAQQIHYICRIEIVLYNSAARTGGATPVVVTSTNLPGNPAWTFPSAGAVGTVDRLVIEFPVPLASVAPGAATTIVCPATTGIIWRVNVTYKAVW